ASDNSSTASPACTWPRNSASERKRVPLPARSRTRARDQYQVAACPLAHGVSFSGSANGTARRSANATTAPRSRAGLRLASPRVNRHSSRPTSVRTEAAPPPATGTAPSLHRRWRLGEKRRRSGANQVGIGDFVTWQGDLV